MRFPVVNLLTIIRSKLAAYFNRTARNDLEDLAWLVRRYRHDIPQIRNQLNSQHRRHFIDGATVAQVPGLALIRQALGDH